MSKTGKIALIVLLVVLALLTALFVFNMNLTEDSVRGLVLR